MGCRDGCIARNWQSLDRETHCCGCKHLPCRTQQGGLTAAMYKCNAGKSIHRNITDAVNRLHDYDRTMDLNYRALVALSLTLLPALKAGKGRIIYSSSVSTLYPMAPGWSAYHASKSAANAWCETASSEFERSGIRVHVAYLPLVHTAMSDVNEQYCSLPGYSPADAANILLRLCMRKGYCYKPWWAKLSAPIACLFAPVIRLCYKKTR